MASDRNPKEKEARSGDRASLERASCDLQEANRGSKTNKALYFSRSPIPYGEGPLLHHIGIYAYRQAALERFVNLPPSPLERREKLEQLRALEAGMQIGVAIVDTVPLGVDTPEQLEAVRHMRLPPECS